MVLTSPIFLSRALRATLKAGVQRFEGLRLTQETALVTFFEAEAYRAQKRWASKQAATEQMEPSYSG